MEDAIEEPRGVAVTTRLAHWTNVLSSAAIYTGSSYTNTDSAWRTWMDVPTSITTSSTTTASLYTASTDMAWVRWVVNDMAAAQVYARAQRAGAGRRAPFTPAEQEARIEAIARKRDEAKARARELLVENLSPSQRESYVKHGFFLVEIGGKTYRIDQGTHGNVAMVDAAGPIERYCVQPNGVPDEDAMLAQKLALELNPEEFFRKANVTRIRAVSA